MPFQDTPTVLLHSRQIMDSCLLEIGGISYDISIKELRDIFSSAQQIPQDWLLEYIKEQLPHKESIVSQRLAQYLYETWLIKDSPFDACQHPFDVHLHNTALTSQDISLNQLTYNAYISNLDKQLQQKQLAEILLNTKPLTFYLAKPAELYFEHFNQQENASELKSLPIHPSLANTEIAQSIQNSFSYILPIVQKIFKDSHKIHQFMSYYSPLASITNADDLHHAYVQINSFHLLKTLLPFTNNFTHLNINFLENILQPCMNADVQKSSYSPMVNLFISSVFQQFIPYSSQTTQTKLIPPNDLVAPYFYKSLELNKDTNAILNLYMETEHLPFLDTFNDSNFKPWKSILPISQSNLNTDNRLFLKYCHYLYASENKSNRTFSEKDNDFYNTNINHITTRIHTSSEITATLDLVIEPQNSAQLDEISFEFSKGNFPQEFAFTLSSILNSAQTTLIEPALDILLKNNNLLKVLQLAVFSDINFHHSNSKILEHPIVSKAILEDPEIFKNIFIKNPNWTHQAIMNSSFMEKLYEMRCSCKNFSYKHLVDEVSYITQNIPMLNMRKTTNPIFQNYYEDILNDALTETHKKLFSMSTQEALHPFKHIGQLQPHILEKIHLKIWDYVPPTVGYNNLALMIYSQITIKPEEAKEIIDIFKNIATIIPVENFYINTLGSNFFQKTDNFIDLILNAETRSYPSHDIHPQGSKIYVSEPLLYQQVSTNKELLKNHQIMSHMLIMGIISHDNNELSEEINNAFQYSYIYKEMLYILNHKKSNLSNNKLILVRENVEHLLCSHHCKPEFLNLINIDDNEKISFRNSQIKSNISEKLDIFFEFLYLDINSPKNLKTTVKVKKF